MDGGKVGLDAIPPLPAEQPDMLSERLATAKNKRQDLAIFNMALPCVLLFRDIGCSLRLVATNGSTQFATVPS